MSNELSISANTKVSLNFSITLENGQVVDSNFDRDPVSFVMGDGSLLPGFESRLMGLKAGDEANFLIAPEDGFGEPPEANSNAVEGDGGGEEANQEEGMAPTLADAAGSAVPIDAATSPLDVRENLMPVRLSTLNASVLTYALNWSESKRS